MVPGRGIFGLVEAVVLAGGKSTDPLALKFGVAAKSLVPYRGRPQVEYVLEALAQVGLPVVYVGPSASLWPRPSLMLPDQGSMLANLKLALERVQSERVLVCTADIPFLTPQAVGYVLEHAPGQADLVYTVVARPTIEARFPRMRRTYARLSDGEFTGGNLVLLNRSNFGKALPLAQQAFDLRKKPLALASRIGWGTLLSVLLGRATIAQLEARISQLLQLKARALVVPYAEVGVDLDEEADLVWLEEQ